MDSFVNARAQSARKHDSKAEILTVYGAADLMKVSRYTVAAMIRDGRLPAAKIGREYRIRRDDVLALLEHLAAPPVIAIPKKVGRPRTVPDAHARRRKTA